MEAICRWRLPHTPLITRFGREGRFDVFCFVMACFLFAVGFGTGIELGEEELNLVAGGTGSRELYSAGDGFIAGVTAGFTSSELRLTTSASLTTAFDAFDVRRCLLADARI